MLFPNVPEDVNEIYDMKTIFIIVSGIADIPYEETCGKTPLMLADTPSLDALAKCGCCGSILTLPEVVELSSHNAILSMLGYDLGKEMPSAESLEKFGKSALMTPESGAPGFFIIPKFSGHGVVISARPAVKGIGKMALLHPLDIITDTNGGESTLRQMADAAINAIEKEEFVFLHVECAAAMSRKGDLRGKIEAIEKIDRDIITPIADYVWNAKEQMNMVLTTDCITSWKTRKNERGEVPAVVYFNDDLPYNTDRFDEQSVEEGPLNAPLPGDLIRKLITFEPLIEDDF